VMWWKTAMGEMDAEVERAMRSNGIHAEPVDDAAPAPN
jgi:hypothetical protein